ncbi:hypothetical protein UC34_01045 [Pandoraea vervacti]|uniref:Effector protein BipC n=1 Tax=Pandoraea vervacti TaxID=656178 RepID=A0ABM5SU54_9BURK|nr:hypothetical protein [Pandoraea vervacti]AJP55955.1 hypothetical protein UC34_01045 [Pandoraea vervacti]
MNILEVSHKPVVPPLDSLDAKDAPPPALLHNVFTPYLDDEEDDDGGYRPSLLSPPLDADRDGALDWLRGLDAKDKPGNQDGGSQYGSLISADVVLLGKFFEFFQKSFQNGIELRNKMADVNLKSVIAGSDAIKEAGKAQMWGGISSGLTQGLLGGFGAFKNFSAVSKERSALKMQSPKPDTPPASPPVTPSPDAPSTANTPDGQLPGTRAPGMDADDILDTAPPPRVNASDDVPDTPGVPPSPTSGNATPPDIPDGPGPDALNLNARSDAAVGGIFSMVAGPLANMMNGTAQYAAALEQQNQKLADSGAQLSRDGTTNSQEQANIDLTLSREMLKVCDAVSQAKTGTGSAIAGNVRA